MGAPLMARIEDAIMARVRDARGLGYALPTIASYGGEFDDEELMAQALRRFPAVWVTFGGAGRPERKGAGQWLQPATFVTMVGARNVRGERQTRHGTVAQVGSYQLAADVRDLLIRQDFGLPVEPLKPGALRTLFNTRLAREAYSVLALEWHTAWAVKAPQEADLDDLLRVGLNYHLEPDDGTADASDLATLAQ